MLTDFVVFILSHGRPNHVLTYRTLRTQGYTGPIYLVVDTEDPHAPTYIENFGNQVLLFDKATIAPLFDEGDNFEGHHGVIYARNACFHLACKLGVTYFLELDDDYQSFCYRFDDTFHFIKDTRVKNLDSIFDAMLHFYQTIPALSIAFMQSGDLIGGADSPYMQAIQTSRKCMNSFFCSTARPFTFVGRINEDVNAYCWLQSRGWLFLSVNSVLLHQGQTQLHPGGMSSLYHGTGTYIKSFYTVMYAPSSVTVALLQSAHPRLHHKICWEQTVPCILSTDYRHGIAPNTPVPTFVWPGCPGLAV